MTTLRTWMFDSGRFPLGIGLLSLTFCSACATRGNVEMLEAQLRSQENRIRTYERNVAELEQELKVSHRELDLMRSSLSGQATTVAFEEETSSLSRVEELVFNTLLTGGQDQDEVSGDERFHAVFYPADAQGGSVKLSGEIEIEAIDPSRESGDRSLGRWQYSTSDARQLWHSGFLSAGFQISEEWKRSPQGNKVVLIARLTTRDGRKFEATHTLPVRVTEGQRTVPDPEPWEHDEPPPKLLTPRKSAALKLEDTAGPDATTTPLFGDLKKSPGAAVETSDNWTEAEIPVIR